MPTAIEDVFCGAEDLVSLFFTSGTTGLPKGTMQTNKCLVASLKTMSVYNQMSVGKEVHLCVLPLFNNFATVCILNGALFDGGSLVLIPRWDTEKVLHAIGRHRCTIMIGTPTMYIYMLRGYDPKRHDISSMRMCITGGSS